MMAQVLPFRRREKLIAPNDGRTADVISGYFDTEPHRVREQVEQALRKLRGVEFDTIVCTGLSGLIMASPMAIEMAKNLFIVRKKDETSHGDYLAEGHLGRRWLFVDDFIGSGRTFMKVNTAIENICNGQWYKSDKSKWKDWEWDTHCVGIYEYQGRVNPYEAKFSRSEDKPYDAYDSSSMKNIYWEDVR